MHDSPTFPAGGRLGPYTLHSHLGSGASAAVFLGVDDAGNRHAIKVRRTGVAQLDRRFLREFESMRTLRIPGVVRVHEAGIADDVLWFSMDIVVDGRPFVEVVQAAPDVSARVKVASNLGRQLLDVLGELHQAGFVHRDVKPTNVLVDAEGQVRVLDFGIGRFFGDGDSVGVEGEILGTLPFMAPEQLAGLPIDHRVDLFAAGVMLYEAIDGERPRPQTAVGWVARTCGERLVPLACKHREVPRGLSYVVERLCTVDPRDRIEAAEASNLLRGVALGRDPGHWPEPPYVELGEAIAELDGCIGNRGLSAVCVLEGATGSGRTRLAEQVHRQGMTQGFWPIHTRCSVDGVGAPLGEILGVLLHSIDDDEWHRTVAADDADRLRRMWPHLHLRSTVARSEVPSLAEAADAAARCVVRASGQRPVLIVVHDVEQIDDVTARAVQRLASRAGTRLGLLLIHEKRWESQLSRQLVATLRSRYKAAVIDVPPIDETQARAIAAAVCPHGAPRAAAGTPLRAVEAGLDALAAWRGERWYPPDTMVWPLVVRPRLPEVLLARLSGTSILDSPWVRRTDQDQDVGLVGRLARIAAGARLADLRGAARAIADTWVNELGAEDADAEIATLRLLAGDRAAAWAPAVRAARVAEEDGRYADARRLLLLVDTLRAPDPADPTLAFVLALTRARVALRTEAAAPRIALVDGVDRVVQRAHDDHLAKLLRAQYQVRAGELRGGLIAALRVASPNVNAAPHVVVRSLLVATETRFLLGQAEEAASQLERARTVLAEHPEPRLEVQVMAWESEIQFRRGDLAGCRRHLQDGLRRAAETRYVRGAAMAAGRLGQVLRMLGKRREAELHTRSAYDAFRSTTDLVLETETGLDLATLRVERGDVAGARHLLDETLRRVRSLGLEPLLARAMRVALHIATIRADPSDAAVALPALDPEADPESPAALVRWWRTRGDVDRALEVPPPAPGYGEVAWRIERARAALAGGSSDTADAEQAIRDAEKASFAELALYGRLILGVAGRGKDVAWKALLSQAASSMYTEVFLGAIEMDARRADATGDGASSRGQWRTLRARSEELGYRPGVEEASGWLSSETASIR